MTNYYFDTSALLKGYVNEEGSGWVRSLVNASDQLIFISAVTTVEVACAFARRYREGVLSPEAYEQVWQAFSYDSQQKYYQVRIAKRVLEAASRLARQQPLRAYDAIQLGTAWIMTERLKKHEESPITFVAADRRLLQIAEDIGFSVMNPSEHDVA